MEQRLDLVSNDAGELVRREKSRELGAEVVVAIYRLLRLARMHDTANKAFVSQLEQTHALVGEYGLRADGHVNVLFAQRAVFVAGQLLKGSRQVYEAVTELGEMLDWCGGAELTVQRDVTAPELKAFAESVAQALRVEKAKGFRSPSPKIRLRPVNDLALMRGLDVEDLTPDQRIVRTYATAVVIMRRLFEDLAAGRFVLPRRVKRVAQKLVDLSEGATPAYLGITEMRNANHDDAGRAVNGAILAVSMARQLTTDRTLLAQIAMAAMLHDVGRPRAIAIASGGEAGTEGIQAFLTDAAEDELAAGTAAVLTALGRLNEATITRTVIAFEAQWLRRAQSLGPEYRGVRAATLQARMIAVARRYNDLLIPEPGMPPPPPDYAIGTLWKELTNPTDRVVVRLLASSLRLFPVGTVVGLTTGEVAAVIPGGERDAGPARPRVRIVMDETGAPLDRGLDVDLARPEPGGPPRAIAKILSVEGWAKGLSLRPRADGEEVAEPEPMPWEREGVKPPSVSRIIAAPAADRGAAPPGKPGGATPPPAGRATVPSPAAAAAKPATKRPTATGAIAPSFDARPAAPAAESPAPRAPLAPPFEPSPAAPPARAPLAPPFEPPAAPPSPAASARERATPPPASERVTPSSRRVAISAPIAVRPTPSPPLQVPEVASPRERATPPPVSERVTPSSRRVVLGAKATPSPPLAQPPAPAASPPPPVRPTPSPPAKAAPVAPPVAARAPGPLPTPSPGPVAPGKGATAGEDQPVRWGRRLEDFPAATPPPPQRAPGPLEARTKIAPSASTAAMQSEAARLVPPDLVPSAHGTLGVTPLAHILVYMLDNRASGSVSFHEPDGWEHIVSFYEGAPAMAKTERPMALLGNELVSRGALTRDVMLRGVEEARRAGLLLGEHLVRAGAVGRGELVTALHSQVVHKVASLANLPEGTRYAFYPGRNFLEGWAGGELYPADPLSTILDAVRGWMDRVRILGTLSRIGAQPLVLHPDADLSPLELNAEEQVVLAVIRNEGIPLAHLFDRQVADVEAVRSIVYMLAITRQFEFSRERGAPMQGGRPAPPPRPTRRRASGALQVTVPDPRVSERIEAAQTPGEIPVAVTPLPLARDTEPGPAVAPAAPPSTEGVDAGWDDEEAAAIAEAERIAEAEEEAEAAAAVDVEIDDEEFDDPVAAPPPAGAPLDADPAERFLQAMNDFRLAQEALQRGDVADAEAYALRAVEGDPGNGDHIALLAWIRAKDAPPDQLEESLFLLGQVLDEEPTLLRARLYRGRLHKRAENLLDALRDFEAVLEVNARHREAASEVKFLRLRLRNE